MAAIDPRNFQGIDAARPAIAISPIFYRPFEDECRRFDCVRLSCLEYGILKICFDCSSNRKLQ